MTASAPKVSERKGMRVLHFVLVVGLLIFMTVSGLLFWLGTAPLQPDAETSLVGSLTVVALVAIALGWAWALNRIPARGPGRSVEEYWSSVESRSTALLLWVLWEGGAMLGSVGTLLTGSAYPAVSALLGVALLMIHGPVHLEGRQ